MSQFIFTKKHREYFKEQKGMQKLAKDLFGGDYFMANNFQNWAMINNYLKLNSAHCFIIIN